MNKVRSLDRFIRPVESRYGEMYCFVADQFIGRSLVEYGEWAQSEIDLLVSFLSPGDVVIDIGAYIGTHTLAFARHVGAGGQVYAFEAHPDHFAVLEKNVSRNNLRCVTLFNVGLSDSSDDMGIERHDLPREGNFGGTALQALNGSEKLHRIKMTTLDDVSLERCDLVKIDAEGMESRILKGAHKLLKKLKPIVFSECNSLAEGWSCIEIMRGYGYDTYLLNDAAFNPNNYRGNRENIFDVARETGLLFVSAAERTAVQERREIYTDLAVVNSLDDLALGMLRKPQYKHEILAKTAMGRSVGVQFFANESELAVLRAETEKLRSVVTQSEAELKALRNEADTLRSERASLVADTNALEMKAVEREKRMAILSKAVEECDARVSDLVRTIAERDEQVKTLHTEARVQREQIGQLEASIERLTSQLREREAQVSDLNRAVTDRDAQIAGLRAEIQQQQQALAEQIGRAATLSQSLSERDEQVKTLHTEARVQREQIGRLEASIEQLTSQVREREAQVSDLNRAVTDRDAQIAGLRAEIQQQQQALAEQIGRAATLSQSLSERDEQVKTLHTEARVQREQIGRLEASIEQLTSQVRERDQKLASLTEGIECQRAEIASLNHSVANLRANVLEQQQRIAEILSSTSWKIAAPIRWLGRFVRRS